MTNLIHLAKETTDLVKITITHNEINTCLLVYMQGKYIVC